MFPNRNQIAIFKEYWLLNVDDEKDVPASVLKKLTFKAVKNDFNPDKNNENPDKNTRNPQSKVKESKEDKSIVSARWDKEDASPLLLVIGGYFEQRIRNATRRDMDILNQLCLLYGKDDIMAAIDKTVGRGTSAAYIESILKNPNRDNAIPGQSSGPDLMDPERYKNFGK